MGGISLGIVIITGQSADNYLSAFQTLKQLIGSNGFGGKGKPNIFMIDDSLAEKYAYRLVSLNPLYYYAHNIFHILQAVWRWL